MDGIVGFEDGAECWIVGFVKFFFFLFCVVFGGKANDGGAGQGCMARRMA